MNFLKLNPEEKLIAIFRKHPIFIWIAMIKYIVLAIIPAILLPYLNNSLMVDFYGYGSIFYFSFLIVLWVSFFIEWTDFMLDTWILTDERLVDIEQISLFNRQVSTLSLDRVQDITTAEAGFLETMFGVGVVIVQTAGESQEFKIYGIKDPHHVKDLIQHAYRQGRQDILHEIANLRS
jgi:uncharacterized membrane protein YdbT with pleckstrin-like domain